MLSRPPKIRHPWVAMGNPRAFGPPALLLFFTWGLFLVGCGGDANEGLGELPPTLDAIQQHVFTPGCATSACHDRVTRGGDLDLSNAQVSYDQMVNVGSKNPVAKANSSTAMCQINSSRICSATGFEIRRSNLETLSRTHRVPSRRITKHQRSASDQWNDSH